MMENCTQLFHNQSSSCQLAGESRHTHLASFACTLYPRSDNFAKHKKCKYKSLLLHKVSGYRKTMLPKSNLDPSHNPTVTERHLSLPLRHPIPQFPPHHVVETSLKWAGGVHSLEVQSLHQRHSNKGSFFLSEWGSEGLRACIFSRDNFSVVCDIANYSAGRIQTNHKA